MAYEPPAGYIGSKRLESDGKKDAHRELDDKKAETCTKDNALLQFRSYVKFYYPDWKIYGKPQVKELTEGFESPCSYQIQFTTSDPHLQYITEKEVIAVQIAFTFDYSRYRFTTIRGMLY